MECVQQIRISDPTLRDGNHAVGHQLSAENIASYCKAADAAGIAIDRKSVMEMGWALHHCNLGKQKLRTILH